MSPEFIQGHNTVGREMMLAVPLDQAHALADRIAEILPDEYLVGDKDGYLAFPERKDYDYGSDTIQRAPEFLAKREDARRLRTEAAAELETELARAEAKNR